MSDIQIVLKATDEASGVIKDLGSSLGNLSGIAQGAVVAGFAAAAAGVVALGAGLTVAINEAIEAENTHVKLAQVLKATGVAAEEQATAWANAQGKVVTTTGLSSEKLTELNQNYRLTEIAIAEQQSKLDALAKAHGTANTQYEKESIALDQLKSKLSGLNAEIAAGQPQTVSLASALGLVEPKARISEKAVYDLATNMRDLAGGSDDAVLAAETVLLRFQEISSTNFPKATEATLNLAAVLGTDTASAAQMLGRALEDPGTGLRALSQAGIVFTDQQKTMLKSMTDAGDIAGAQKYILDALAETTSGAAAAAANTFSGQMEIMKGHLLEVAEGIGAKLLPLLKDGLAVIMPVVEKAAAQISASFVVLLPHVLELADKMGGLVEQVLALLGIDISKFDLQVVILQATGIISDIIAKAGEFVDFISANLPGVIAYFQPIIDAAQGLATSFTSSMPQIESTVMGMKDSLFATFGELGPVIIGNVSGALNTLTAIWNDHGAEILSIISTAWNAIVLTVGGAMTLISGVISSAMLLIQGIINAVSLAMKGDWQGAWDAIVTAVSLAVLKLMDSINSIFESIASKMGTSMSDIRKTWQTDWDLFVTIVKQIWVNIQDAISTKLIEIVTTIKTGITDAIQAAKDTYDSWVQLGKDIVANIALGISQMVAGLIQDVIDMVNAALNAAAKALAGGGSYSIPGYTGTTNTTGGLGGERSPQMGGTNAPTSAGGSGNVFNFYASNDLDIELLARRVAQVIAAA